MDIGIYLHHKDIQHNMHPLPPNPTLPIPPPFTFSLDTLEAPAERMCMYLKNMSNRIPFFKM